MKYFVIHNSDGNIRMECMDEATLNGYLKACDDAGDSDYFGDLSKVHFLNKVPDLAYMGAWEYLIIRGEVVAPEAVKVVTQFEIK